MHCRPQQGHEPSLRARQRHKKEDSKEVEVLKSIFTIISV